jgi:hypothetical protein
MELWRDLNGERVSAEMLQLLSKPAALPPAGMSAGIFAKLLIS